MKNKIKGQLKEIKKRQRGEFKEQGAVISDDKKPGAGKMKIDLHCHTEASWDCITPIERFPQRLIEQGIKVQGITDHNEIWGAIKLKKIVSNKGLDIKIIVGEEILTSEGEIIGLFLKEKIEKGLSPEKTLEKIKAQGGISILPHGFDPLKRYRLSDGARKRVEGQIDIIETFNTRVSRKRWNRKALKYAYTMDKFISAGTDAHTIKDVGTAWVEVPECEINDSKDLLNSLRGGVPTGTWVNPLQSLMYRGWDIVRDVVFGVERAVGEI